MTQLRQLSLLDPPRYPRGPGAPSVSTSLEAAARVAPTVEQRRAAVLALLAERPCTVHEAAAALGLPVASIQPRFSELRRMGRIAPSGERRTNASGARAHVWRIAV